MERQTNPPVISLPRDWPGRIKSATLHVISLAYDESWEPEPVQSIDLTYRKVQNVRAISTANSTAEFAESTHTRHTRTHSLMLRAPPNAR